MHKLGCFVVDDRGDVQLGSSGQQPFHREIATSDDGTLKAIKEAGFIEWRVHEGHIRLRLRPSMISQQAHARVVSWFKHLQPQRVLLSYFAFDQWEYEYIQSTRETLRRLDELIELHGSLGPEGIRHRVRSENQLRKVGKFSLAVEYWRAHRDCFDPLTAKRTLDPILSGRWTLCEKFASGSFALSDFGKNNPVHARKWLHRAIGEPLSEAPDQQYVRACEKVYHDVARAFQPCHDEVDAMVTWPGHGRMRNRYQRLMLPFRTFGKSGHRATIRTWHLTATVCDRTVGLLD